MDRPERVTSAVRVILDDGIVRVVGLGNTHTAASVAEMCDAVLDLTDGKRLPILFDTRTWGEIEPTSWAAFIQRLEDICPAAAVLGNMGEFDEAYVGSYPMIIDSLVVPFRVFGEEEPALQFLANYQGDLRTATTAAADLEYGDGVVRVLGKGHRHTPTTVAETLSTAQRLAGGRARILFVNPTWTFDPPSWAQFMGMVGDVAVAAAVVTDDDEVLERLGSYPEVIDGLLIPFRVFTDEGAAEAFLADHASA